MAANQISGLQFVLSARIDGLQKGLNQAGKSLQTLERQTRNVQNLLAGFGIGFGLFQVGRAVISSINAFKDFESQMAEVKAITSATDEQFKELSDEAIKLGRATIFTAKQIGELQVAYGRLGFSVDEIINATEATLDLAAATNIDLASAAEVAGSTLRAFGLDAAQTARVTDVMAASLNTSALTVDSFREAMKFVAPIARAAGASIEQTSGLLAVLANNGLKGSIAGTSLRRIFSDLTRDGRPLQERLDELAKRGLSLSDAYDEIGRVAQTALLVLSKNTASAKEYAAALLEVEGETRRIRDIRLDTLEGDIVRLTSAWNGFLISAQQGFGFWRLTVQQMTKSFNDLVGEVSAAQTILPLLIKEIQLDGLGFFLKPLIEDLREARRVAGEKIDESFVERLATQAGLSKKQLDKVLEVVRSINAELSPKEVAVTGFIDRFGDPRRLEKTKENYEKLTESLDQYIQAENESIFAIRNSVRAGQTAVEEGAKQIKFRKEQIESIKEFVNQILPLFSNELGAPDTGKFDGFLQKLESDLKRLRELQEEALTPIDAAKFAEPIRVLVDRIKDIKDGFAGVDAQVRRFAKSTGDAFTITAKSVDDLTKKFNEADLFKNFRSEFTKTSGLIPFLEARLNSLEEAQRRAFDPDVIRAYQVEIDKLKNELDSLKGAFEKSSKVLIDLASVAATAFQGIGFAIGDALSNARSLGNGLLDVLGGILIQLGEIAIQTGVGILAIQQALKSLNPYVAIAAGVALIALGRYVSNQARQLGSSGGGSVPRSSGSSSPAFAQDSAAQLQVVSMVIRGQDLHVIMSNYERNNRNTRNG